MEHFTPTSLILVTGANGHVAQHVVSQLLSLPPSHRPKVRATVRSDTSAAGLKSVFSSHISSGILSFAYIPDIAQPGAFDDAVKDVTHIAHIASPLIVGATDAEQDVLKPAIGGTTSLLKSALNMSTLQAVVITSSFAAVHDPMHGLHPEKTYTSKDWNPITYEEAADPNLDLSVWPETYRVFITYMASKKLAEKAAWDFYDSQKPKWRLSVVCPTYIGGPNVLPLAKGADSLSFSQKLLWGVATSKPEDNLPEIDFPYWVDVRDVARAHVLALQSSQADGERFTLAPFSTTYSGVADLVRRELRRDVSRQVQELDCFKVDMGNCESILGMKEREWVGLEKMVLDTVRQVM